MRTTTEARGHHLANYALDALQALPCGCVAAVYRTRPWNVQIVAVEARGPHCLYIQHQQGRVLGVGPDESEETRP